MNNVLIITPQNIMPPTDGGKLCMYSRIVALNNLNNKVYLAMGNTDVNITEEYPKALTYLSGYISSPRVNKEIYKSNIRDIFFEICKWFLSGKPRQAQTLDSLDNRKKIMDFINDNFINIIVLETVFAAELIDLEICKQKNIRIVVIEHNVEYEFIKDCLPNMRMAAYMESRRVKKYEKRVNDIADEVIAISPYDVEKIKNNLNISHARYLPVTLSATESVWEEHNSDYILFTGSLNFPPNFKGIKWFLEKVWGQYHMLYPDIKLKITGAANKEASKMLSRYKNVFLTGFLEEAEFDKLKQNALFEIIPVISGSGIKIKLLEALSMGIPVIGTKHCYEGIPFDEIHNPYYVAKDEKDFLQAMSLFTKDKSIRDEYSKNGNEFYNLIYASDCNKKNWNDVVTGNFS